MQTVNINKRIILTTFSVAVIYATLSTHYLVSEVCAFTFPEVVSKVKSCVVKVLSKREGRFGSGFFIDKIGHVVTCAHVLRSEITGEYEKEFTIEFFWQVVDSVGNKEQHLSTMNATIDTIAEKFDIAILNVNIIQAGFSFVPYLPIGNSDKITEGEEISTCGFIPDGFTLSRPIAVRGIISVIRDSVFDLKLNNRVNIFQLDQQIAGGLSGSPLFSVNLGVIGFMDASILPDQKTKQSGFSYALAINQVKKILEKYEYWKVNGSEK